MRLHFTENGMKVLRPDDRFQIVFPVHTKTIQVTENAYLSTLHCACLESFLVFSVGHLGFFQIKMHWDWVWDHMINRFQKSAFSVSSTHPHGYCCVFKSFHSGERFQNLRFHRKRNIISIVFVWSGDKRVDTAGNFVRIWSVYILCANNSTLITRSVQSLLSHLSA